MSSRFVQFRRVFRLVFPVVVRFVPLPVVRRARHFKYIYMLVALIRLYMYICASARVIKHSSSFKAKKEGKKESWRRNFWNEIFVPTHVWFWSRTKLWFVHTFGFRERKIRFVEKRTPEQKFGPRRGFPPGFPQIPTHSECPQSTRKSAIWWKG